MALFTDADVLTLDDLLQYETSLVQVASSHSINVETKIRLSMDAVSDTLLLWLLQAGGSDPQYLSRRLLGVSTVVVTPPLQRWICFESLSRFFAEAYNVQLNTRFQGKWTEYRDQAREASGMVFMSGIGIVNNPLPKPGMPSVSIGSGNSQAGSLFIETAWVDGQGNESAVSPVNGVILSPSSAVSVSMFEGLTVVPNTAIGWNVYAGTDESSLTLQNNLVLPVGSAWQLPDAGLVNGRAPLGGQLPNFYILLPRKIERG